jgi:3-isopropylmalate/(R)-2-methylmalate dehydratase large subunit
MTIAEKILAIHSGRENVTPGEYVWAKVDETSPGINVWAFKELRELGIKKVFDPERVWNVYFNPAPPQSVETAEDVAALRRAVEEYGMKNWFEYGRHGIIHQVFAENGYCVPGDLVAMEDSHTTSYGVFNVASCPIYIECAYVMATGKLWFLVPESIKFWLTGRLPELCMGKDVMLKILATWGSDVALYKSAEFLGPLAREMTLASRWTIAAMGIEIGAKFALFEADQKTFDFLKGRTNRSYNPVKSDSDAQYAQEYVVDVTDLEPLVACPHDPSNVRSTVEVEKENVKINQVFLGSCINGRQEDLEIAARILDGNKIHPDVRMIVSPASMEVWKDALKAGWLETFAEAETLVCHPTCGPCSGGDLGVLAAGEACISSSCRNFQGRMGSSKSSIYLANAATAAASAIAGKIVDPRKYL